ncbi:MAG: GAF domain-containing protein [Deltaproteobacteria bacterium]|nr:GAF domain-containing protein [Deltaproteobacteria bacterium]
MSDSHGSGGDDHDLVAKKKEFLEAFFKKGIEFTEELLRENEKLRYRVVQLEEQLATTSRSIPTQATLKELVEKIHALEIERDQMLERFALVERENREYTTRFVEIEKENNNLASLYVAVYQLHSTFEMREVLQIVVEILLNFVGAKRFALFLIDEKARALRAIAAEGFPRGEVPTPPLGQGIIGRVGETGVSHVGVIRPGVRGEAEPVICVPLTIKGRGVVGAVAVWEFLAQKTELLDVDHELFNLLGAHVGSALEAARLASEAGNTPRLHFSALEGLIT